MKISVAWVKKTNSDLGKMIQLQNFYNGLTLSFALVSILPMPSSSAIITWVMFEKVIDCEKRFDNKHDYYVAL